MALELNEIQSAELLNAEDTVLHLLKKLAQQVEEPNALDIHQTIHELGLAMEGLPQCEALLEHIYADGLYGRKWVCGKDNIIVTEIHKVQHISSLIKGRIAVMSDQGWAILEAPQFFVTEPGTQRVILTLEDTVFTTVHLNPDNERDPDVLKARLTVRSFDELPELAKGVLR